MTNFLKTSDFERSKLDALIESAMRLKASPSSNRPLTGKSIALVFFNPSLRTRASMQVGIYELGGNAVILEPGGTSWTLEHREPGCVDAVAGAWALGLALHQAGLAQDSQVF